jgi:hypothetical protein
VGEHAVVMFVNSKLFHRHQPYHLSDLLSKTRRLLLSRQRRIRKRVTRRLGLTGGASGCSTSFRSRSPPTSTPEGRDRKNETDVRISCGTLFIQQCTSDMATSILAECFNHPIDSLSLDNRLNLHSFLFAAQDGCEWSNFTSRSSPGPTQH